MSIEELLQIEYGLVRRPWTEPDLDQFDVWQVRLQVGSFRSDEDNEPSWDTVAQAWLYGMDPDRNVLVGQRPFDVADAHSADAASYFEYVFDPRVLSGTTSTSSSRG